MTYSVVWTRPAERMLLSLPWRSAARVAREVLHFAETGEGDVRRLPEATEAPLRLRVAPYLVRFSSDRITRTLTIWSVTGK
jgi:mRNA-degrading endonuclease RelE of RelBE toxin-antitoxin system